MFSSETLHQFRVPAAAKIHDSAVPVFSGLLSSGIAEEVLKAFSSYFSLSLSNSHIFSGQVEYLRFSSSFPQFTYLVKQPA